MSQSRSQAAVARQTEANKSPSHSRDINMGNATVLYGWTNDGRQGWRLIGGGVTADYMTAVRHAVEIDRLIAMHAKAV